MRSAGQLAALSAPLFAFSQLSFRTFLRTLTSWFRSNPSDSIFFSIFRRVFCRAAFSGTFLRIAEFSGTRSIKDWAATCVPKRVKHELKSLSTCECEKKQSKPLHSLFINLLYTLLVKKKILLCIFFDHSYFRIFSSYCVDDTLREIFCKAWEQRSRERGSALGRVFSRAKEDVK